MASHTPRLTTPRIPTESELRRLISGREQAEFSKYIMQARNDVAYVGGTGVIDLKQFGFGVGRHLLRDVEMPDHGIYVTLDDYLREPVKLELGISASSRQIADFLLRQHSVRDMLIALAQLNRIRHMDDQLNELREAFTLSIPEKARPPLNAAIANKAETHFFLARQTIMLAAREVILKGGSGAARPDGSPLMTAIMLTHALASDIGPLDEGGPQIWPGMSVAALMEIVANASFNTNEWWVSQLDRLWRIWIRYGSLVNEPLTRAPFDQLVRDALGLDIGSIALLSLSLALPALHWRYPSPVLMPGQFVTDANVSEIDAFLSYVAADVDDLRRRLLQQQAPWGFLPFEESPVIDLGSELLVFDPDFLMKRTTTGLYWAVAKSETKRVGEKGFRAWSKGHGLAIEAAVEEQLQALVQTPRLIGTSESQQTYFTEKDLQRAYPGKKGRAGRQCDGVIWLPRCWIAFEVVAFYVKVSARQGLDIDAFRDDANKLMNELGQLDATAKNLLSDGGQALIGFPPSEIHIQPILVQGGYFPLHPAISAYIDDRINRDRLFARSAIGPYERDSRIRKPVIIHMDELETLEAIAERHQDVLQIIDDWQQSTRRAGPLKNFLIAANREDHPSRLDADKAGALLKAFRSRLENVT